MFSATSRVRSITLQHFVNDFNFFLVLPRRRLAVVAVLVVVSVEMLASQVDSTSIDVSVRPPPLPSCHFVLLPSPPPPPWPVAVFFISSLSRGGIPPVSRPTQHPRFDPFFGPLKNTPSTPSFPPQTPLRAFGFGKFAFSFLSDLIDALSRQQQQQPFGNRTMETL